MRPGCWIGIRCYGMCWIKLGISLGKGPMIKISSSSLLSGGLSPILKNGAHRSYLARNRNSTSANIYS